MPRKTLNPIAAAVAAAILCVTWWPAPAAAQAARPWKLMSWSSSLGAQSSTYEIMYGLKAFLAFLNANGGVGGREMELYSLDMDDSGPDFTKNLDQLIFQGKPDLVVGGASQLHAGTTAEYFRRVSRPWFGPWSADPTAFLGRQDDPAGIIPTSPVQMDMLFSLAKARMPEGKTLYFVYRDGPRAPQLAAIAQQAARSKGISMRPVRLNLYFRDWESMRDDFPDAGAVMLWTAPGPAAAIRRSLGRDLGPEVIWLTHALNPTGRELIGLSGGLWSGTIFPAVLLPSAEIPEAFSSVMGKYALPGLRAGYRSYLGFTQGQLLAKAVGLAEDRQDPSPAGVLKSLKEITTAGSLYRGQKLPSGPNDPAGAYLAVSDNSGGWHPAEP
jgi:ABC-type branched-subunit amino acid transport system substrate-binding protein